MKLLLSTVAIVVMSGAAYAGEPLTLARGFAPNPTVVTGLSGKVTVDADKIVGAGANCGAGQFMYVPTTPSLVVTAAADLGRMQIKLGNANGAGLLVKFANKKYLCATGNSGPVVFTIDDVPAGKIEIYVGWHTFPTTISDFTVTFEDDVRTAKAAADAHDKDPNVQREKLCASAGEPADTASAVVVATLCEHRRSLPPYVRAWRAIDGGDPNPILAATVIAACGALPKLDYFEWRQCNLDATIDDTVLASALDHATTPEGKALFLAAYETGKHQLAAVAAAMAEHEHGYPADKQVFDDSWQGVAPFVAAYKQWGPKLAEIDAWAKLLSKGPGYAEGCEDKFGAMLKEYVASAVPKPSGDGLGEAIRDPIGFGITEAYAYCIHVRRHDSWPRNVLDEVLTASRRYDSVHELFAQRLYILSYRGRYKDGELSSDRSILRFDQNTDPLSGKLGQENSTQVPKFDGGLVVAKVQTKEDQVILTFKRGSHKITDLVGCQDDVNHPLSIDRGGTIHYASVGCKEKVRTIDDTPPPVWIPKSEATNVTAGTTVRTHDAISRDKGPVAARLLWAKRGTTIVNVLGLVP